MKPIITIKLCYSLEYLFNYGVATMFRDETDYKVGKIIEAPD